MDGLGRQAGEFGHPAAHIVAGGIEFLALKHGVEHAEVGRGVGAAAGDPLPAGGVVGGVGIDQRVPEPALAQPPVDHQVLGQEGGCDHAHAVVHPAGRPELAHAGIDDGIAGAAAPPRLDGVVLVRPGKGVELRAGSCAARDRRNGTGGCRRIPASRARPGTSRSRPTAARACAARQTCRGEISPKARCGDKRDVPSTAGRSRASR